MVGSGPGLAVIVTFIVHIIEIDALLVPRGHSGLWQAGSGYRFHTSLINMGSGGRTLDPTAEPYSGQSRSGVSASTVTSDDVATGTTGLLLHDPLFSKGATFLQPFPQRQPMTWPISFSTVAGEWSNGFRETVHASGSEIVKGVRTRSACDSSDCWCM